MADAIAGEALRLPGHEERWRERTSFLFAGLHEATLRHPRALPLIATAAIRTPNGRRWMDALMRALLEGGFTADEAARIYHSLGAFTLGLGYAQLLARDVPKAAVVAQLAGHRGEYPSLMGRRPAPHGVGPAGRFRGGFRGPPRLCRRAPGPRSAARAGLAMKVLMILPRESAAAGPRRPLKYSLFPPLGLATLAAYLDPDDEVELCDEHVEDVPLDREPDLVVIEAYVTSARRAYALAVHYRDRGAHVCLGGLHPTALPVEAARHANSVFVGPGEDIWPRFLADLKARSPGRIYRSHTRSLAGAPPPRRDLIKRGLYLVPNSLVVSRGCPHLCEFCYKESFFAGGSSFYLQPLREALTEVERLPGRHLYFLDDNLFGSPRFAARLFEGMRGMGRVWQAAATVEGVLRPGLLERAVEAGCRSLFVGFETLSPEGLRSVGKVQNLERATDAGGRDTRLRYEAAIRRMHDLGVMVNASFVFGMDQDDRSVFGRTAEWAVAQGVETATFHILTPYPGTALERRLTAEGRMLTNDWDRYDTRHAVFSPALMSPSQLEAGYRRAYRDFYSWRSILTAAATKDGAAARLRHLLYTAGWKKMEPLWDVAIRHSRVQLLLPLLETILADMTAAGGRSSGGPVPMATAADAPSGGAEPGAAEVA